MRRIALLALAAILGACNPSYVTLDTGTTGCDDCGDDTGTPVVDPNDVDNDDDGYTENGGDCDDGSATVHPGATEVCEDGVDQDCNGGDAECSGGDDTGNPNDGEGNLEITVAYPWGDGAVVCLDYEVVTDRDYLGVISGEAWEDAGGCVEVVDGVATWAIDAGYSADAVRYDVDFPQGGNLCEGYDDTAHLLVETGVTYGVSTWTPVTYSMSWEDSGVTYYGCSAAAYSPE